MLGKDGRSRTSWTNLLKAKVGDIVFSHHKKALRAIGVVTAEAVESPRPDFGRANGMWLNDGWEVLVRWAVFPEPIIPRDYLAEANQFRQKNFPMNELGKVNMQYLFELPFEFGQILASGVSENLISEISEPSNNDGVEMLIREAEEILSDRVWTRTERHQLVAARLGQGVFAINVAKVEPVCRVTGISERRHLIASHIKPWKLSDNAERLSGDNGLMLSPHIDNLFDRGLITFKDSGQLIISKNLSSVVVERWRVEDQKVIRPFSNGHRKFLEFHRDAVFQN